MANNPQHSVHPGGTKYFYPLLPTGSFLQVTIGGRATGTVAFKTLPSLQDHPTLGDIDLDTLELAPNAALKATVVAALEPIPADILAASSINLATATKKTFFIKDELFSLLFVDDTGNTGDFWIHIKQM